MDSPGTGKTRQFAGVRCPLRCESTAGYAEMQFVKESHMNALQFVLGTVAAIASVGPTLAEVDSLFYPLHLVANARDNITRQAWAAERQQALVVAAQC
jgi:hypothetical protein